jgi:hypothetical protein
VFIDHYSTLTVIISYDRRQKHYFFSDTIKKKKHLGHLFQTFKVTIVVNIITKKVSFLRSALLLFLNLGSLCLGSST